MWGQEEKEESEEEGGPTGIESEQPKSLPPALSLPRPLSGALLRGMQPAALSRTNGGRAPCKPAQLPQNKALQMIPTGNVVCVQAADVRAGGEDPMGR